MNQTPICNRYDTAAAFVSPAQGGAEERTSVTERAKAVRRRPLPTHSGACGAPGSGRRHGGGHVVGTVGGILTFLVAMACIGARVYRQESRTEYQHSRAGLEMYRIDAAVEVKLAELQHTAELRKMTLQSYIAMLEDKDYE